MQLIETLKTKASWAARFDENDDFVLGYQNSYHTQNDKFKFWPKGDNGVWKMSFYVSGVVRGRSSVSFMIQDVDHAADINRGQYHLSTSGTLSLLQNVGSLFDVAQRTVLITSPSEYDPVLRTYVHNKQPQDHLKTVYTGLLTVVKQGTEYSLAPYIK